MEKVLHEVLHECKNREITVYTTGGTNFKGTLVDIFNDEVIEMHGDINKFLIMTKSIIAVDIAVG